MKAENKACMGAEPHEDNGVLEIWNILQEIGVRGFRVRKYGIHRMEYDAAQGRHQAHLTGIIKGS